jgi:hypothetical protein
MRTLQAIGDELSKTLFTGFGGSTNAGLVQKVVRLAEEARQASNYHPYVCEKAATMINWVEIACSQRRHQKWGLPRVEQMARADASRIAGCDYMISESHLTK